MSEEEQKAIEYFKNLDCDLNTLMRIDLENFKTSKKNLLNLIEKQQKEIEREKQYADFYKDLCDKQQKELENNKKFKKDIVNLIMLWDKEDLPDNEIIISVLDTFVAEVSRLEDIEDRKIQVEVKFVEEKRDKYWKDKIREKIKELEGMSISQDIYYDDIKEMLEELLEE